MAEITSYMQSRWVNSPCVIKLNHTFLFHLRRLLVETEYRYSHIKSMSACIHCIIAFLSNFSFCDGNSHKHERHLQCPKRSQVTEDVRRKIIQLVKRHQPAEEITIKRMQKVSFLSGIIITII